MCCFWNTRSASSWCFILQYKFDTCIKKKKRKRQISILAHLNEKYKSALENFPKSRHLTRFTFMQNRNFISLAHTSASISLNSKALASPPKIISSDETCLRLVGKCSKSSLLLIVSNPQRRKFSHRFQHLTLQEGLLFLSSSSSFFFFFLNFSFYRDVFCVLKN